MHTSRARAFSWNKSVARLEEAMRFLVICTAVSRLNWVPLIRTLNTIPLVPEKQRPKRERSAEHSHHPSRGWWPSLSARRRKGACRQHAYEEETLRQPPEAKTAIWQGGRAGRGRAQPIGAGTARRGSLPLPRLLLGPFPLGLSRRGRLSEWCGAVRRWR